MIINKKIITVLTLINLVVSQEIPNEFYQFQLLKLEVDTGSNWKKNSIFGPVRYQNDVNGENDLKVISRLGSSFNLNAINIYGYGHFSFQSNFYGYIYPRIVTDSNSYDRFSGLERDIKRGGFSSGETDISGIGYENNWMIVQFGRGRQSWGAGNNIQLAISENSSSYDYGMLDLNFGKIRTRYFHGYLETDSLMSNRYINGRGIEWNNQESLIIGLSEIVIYSGVGRSVDFAYLNPISSHLEIELNERQNNIDTGSGNGVWQISIDWLVRPNLRLSSNYLFDEFILDKEQKEAGKADGRASSIRLAFSPINNHKSVFTLFTSYISIGTHTFRHEKGSNNFVQRNKPLGLGIGSDCQEITTGANLFLNKALLANLQLGYQISGEKNIKNSLYQPYTDYLDGPFPSGDLSRKISTTGKLQWWINKNLSILTNFEYVIKKANVSEFKFNVGIDIYLENNSIF